MNVEPVDVISLAIAACSLIVAIAALVRTHFAARRISRAAHGAQLFEALRRLRDHAFEYGKPLGGQKPDDLVALHYAISDAHDLREAIDPSLRVRLDSLLSSDVVGIAMSIDPPQFMGMSLTDHLIGEFTELARETHELIKLTQKMRQGVG